MTLPMAICCFLANSV